MERPKDISDAEWRGCQSFAFQYAKQQGYYDDVSHYKDVSNSETYGEVEFEKGLNIAVVTCKFWREFYKGK